MKLAVATTALVAALLGSTAQAENTDDHYACMSDAFRVCWSDIPNRHAVYLCLVANKNKLSDTCRHAIIHSRDRVRPRRRDVSRSQMNFGREND